MSGLEIFIPALGAIILVVLGGFVAQGQRTAPVPVPVKSNKRRR
jgi:hypothetical protein